MRRLVNFGLQVGVAISLSLAAGACAQGTSTADAGSPDARAGAGVRIVRLSAVRGKVELDRGTGRGFEAGFSNLPIVQGNRLRTVGMGWAEVEFEDGGSARITPNSQVSFDTLSRSQDGLLRSGLNLQQGTLYVSRLKGDKSDLVLTAGGKKILLPPDSHVRLDVYPAGSELVVVHGTAQVEDASGAKILVNRKHALKFGGPEETQQLVEAKSEAPGLYDRWDAQAVEYHSHFVWGGATGSVYGGRDLQYYGAFSDLDGCGRVWQPYLASAAFDPAASGVWAWYPGSGYAFVSPYPWGWATFNSGDWISCGANGWGWRPGVWRGLRNHGIVEPIHGPGHHPRPLGEPAAGKPTVVNAGERELVRSTVALDGVSKFPKDSAGLGVPRGLVANLKEISQAVESGKAAPLPSYRGDALAVDPLILTLISERSVGVLRLGDGLGGRPAEGVAFNSRPIAGPVVAGHIGGGYAGGRSNSIGVSSRSGSFSSAGVRSSVSSTSTSASNSTFASHSSGGSSMGSSSGSSSGGGHK